MMDRAAGLGLILLALAMIGLGLWQVGGPEQARIETRDQQRLEDLRAYADHLQCIALRDSGAQTECWGSPMATDRFTRVPFVLTDDRVCATFETDAARNSLQLHHPFVVKDGCIQFRDD